MSMIIAHIVPLLLIMPHMEASWHASRSGVEPAYIIAFTGALFILNFVELSSGVLACYMNSSNVAQKY